MKKETKKVVFLVHAAVIAALYVVLTELSASLGLASGVIQIRISEALTILPYFTPAAIPGLFVGCFLSNLLTGCVFWDILFGSLATLLGACGTWLLRKHKYLAWAPPVFMNVMIVPWVLRFAYAVPDAIPYLMFTVGVGEAITCGAVGTTLLLALEHHRSAVFAE